MEEKYYVYKHIFPNKKIYIGITYQQPEKRWNYGHGYDNTVVGNAIKKYGWKNVKHEILFENLTKEEAEQKEIELIALYKSNQGEYGYNIANGGNHYGKFSEEAKQKISEANKGEKNGMYGKPAWNKGKPNSLETRKKISAANKGKTLSQEHKNKIIKANKERFLKGFSYKGIAREHIIETAKKNIKKAQEKLRKPILKYSLNGDFIEEYISITEACKKNNVDIANVSAVCLGHNQQKTCGGFIWKYKDDSKKIEPTIKGRHKNILQYDKQGNFIKKWFSISSASKELKISATQILKCCKHNGKTAGGYVWIYE